ncbi:replication initiator protein [Microvirus mar14]|uniref:Replication initiator protein n=1 Tax=Microvirus mar14 TaxID=2851146 RepID=A0A8F5MKY2_9VIRU|nr:replication initiator protein [Microvirus mar14]
MNCLNPVTVPNRNPDKAFIYRNGGQPLSYLKVPCGKCAACLYNRQQQVTSRVLLAYEQYPFRVFATLTFQTEPETPNEAFCEFKKFRDRMRKAGYPFYFVVTLEFCPTTDRIHLHSIILSNNQIPYEIIRKQWKSGYSWLEAAPVSTVDYVCKYITKNALRPDARHLFRMSPGLGLPALRRAFTGVSEASPGIFWTKIPRVYPLYGRRGYRLPDNFARTLRPVYMYDYLSLLSGMEKNALGIVQPEKQSDSLTGRVQYVQRKK